MLHFVRRIFPSLGLLLAVFCSILLVMASIAYLRYGSVGNALAALRGQSIIADAYSQSFGHANEGDTVNLTFRLRNLSSRPVRIVGNLTMCTCVMITNLPVTIEPNGKQEIKVVVKPDTFEDFTQNFWLYTNAPGQTDLAFTITGNVNLKPKNPRST